MIQPVLEGWALVAMAMGGLWLIQKKTRDASMVDVAWSLGVGFLAVFFALIYPADAQSHAPRRALVAGLAAIWAARLGVHLLLRVARSTEDGRYQELRRRWGKRADLYFFLFFQAQAIWSVLFALPMLFAMSSPEPLGLLDAAGVAVWGVALFFEAVADRQLSRFRKDPARRAGVCRDGLWRYSRHPNYFFEWVHWWSYVLIGWSGPLGAWTLLGPALMLWFLLKVTGIPPTEAQALRSRGELYREYQRSTSAFVPWPPRRSPGPPPTTQGVRK